MLSEISNFLLHHNFFLALALDGNTLPCLDKSKIIHAIESMIDSETTSSMDMDTNKEIIMDGMTVVNKIYTQI